MAEPAPAPREHGRERSGGGGRLTPWLVGVLAALLGFALVVQVRSTREDADLSSARTSDLVRILDDLDERSQRLDAEQRQLERTRDELLGGANQRAAAREATRAQLRTLEVLAGTVAVRGPGVVLVVIDPARVVTAAELLDAVQELRDAGAEAIQVDGVRWVARSYVVDTDKGIAVDGTRIDPPYEILAIGPAATLSSSLAIPGGVVESIRERGANTVVEQREQLLITALNRPVDPQYAQPAP